MTNDNKCLTTTLREIEKHQPCEPGWDHLLEGLRVGDANDDPLPIEKILEINDFSDALWALRTIKGHDGAMRLYACYCAESALYIYESKFPDDLRPRYAIEEARLFARGKSTKEEMEAAGVDARIAAEDTLRGKKLMNTSVNTRNAARAAASATESSAWIAALGAALAAKSSVTTNLGREFIRLCRLEGEYGEVDK